MYIVIVLFLAGIFSGYFLKSNKKIKIYIDILINWSVFLLLFLLGISVGINETIIRNIGKLGIQALLITIFAMAGSILIAFITYKLFFKNKQNI